MDRLYAAIFGVAISSSDDDFNNFIDIVKSVIEDKPIKKNDGLNLSTLAVYFCLLIFGLFLFYLYLKFTS